MASYHRPHRSKIDKQSRLSPDALTFVNSSHSIDALIDGSESEVAHGTDAVTDEKQVIDFLALSVLDDVKKRVIETAFDHARTRLTLLNRAPFVGLTGEMRNVYVIINLQECI